MEKCAFEKGDKVIWLKPVKMEIIDVDDPDCVEGEVTCDYRTTGEEE